jgi:hypothetical protein
LKIGVGAPAFGVAVVPFTALFPYCDSVINADKYVSFVGRAVFLSNFIFIFVDEHKKITPYGQYIRKELLLCFVF